MDKVLVNKADMDASADAIRSKLMMVKGIKASQFADLILSIDGQKELPPNVHAIPFTVTEDTTSVTVQHGLGRVPMFATVSILDDIVTQKSKYSFVGGINGMSYTKLTDNNGNISVKTNVFWCDCDENTFTIEPSANVSYYKIRPGNYILILVEGE